MTVTVVAHRGLMNGTAENTIAAIEAAVARGVDAVEVDLRSTSDGQLVVMHDETVDRTTNGIGAVANLALSDIRSLDTRDPLSAGLTGERVPTYHEVLEAVRNTRTQIVADIKNVTESLRRGLLSDAKAMKALDRLIVAPRTAGEVAAFKKLDPGVTVLGLLPGRSDVPSAAAADIAAFLEGGADILRFWPSSILDNEQQVLPLAAELLAGEIPVWTCADTLYGDISVKEPERDLRALIAAGVAGIMTNLPELLLEVIGGEGHPTTQRT
ncbi:glycerophosphodiester phosphodiesterase family protein [Tsukamurella sp. 8F]|uniref:glycerophosphodiester phosphodiesterase n=1 Tax=unclassified Tsukamurella TaxID=2633480 RepID=UPI0023B90045|nr:MULTISPECIES: glycerophosphodiester phosphodiesterase family protein [unclassified Tsukamurella]MDF0528648.1 glycerophosphodiester phosphodiesterase family protein [Tsukamurella sp. 8J]MDF0585610.1 glycerophosphodiester phosphodiesterase family protein [Tsukamurella sp. 8F]